MLFALMALSRAWAQYREDRAIILGARLIGAEATAERDAFLALLERALTPEETRLGAAIRTVRRVAIRPTRDEAEQTATLITSSAPISRPCSPRWPAPPAPGSARTSARPD
jgi:hypothetical protein